jgi:hypothetical protein
LERRRDKACAEAAILNGRIDDEAFDPDNRV